MNNRKFYQCLDKVSEGMSNIQQTRLLVFNIRRLPLLFLNSVSSAISFSSAVSSCSSAICAVRALLAPFASTKWPLQLKVGRVATQRDELHRRRLMFEYTSSVASDRGGVGGGVFILRGCRKLLARQSLCGEDVATCFS